jgi:hypothetical protein
MRISLFTSKRLSIRQTLGHSLTHIATLQMISSGTCTLYTFIQEEPSSNLNSFTSCAEIFRSLFFILFSQREFWDSALEMTTIMAGFQI